MITFERRVWTSDFVEKRLRSAGHLAGSAAPAAKAPRSGRRRAPPTHKPLEVALKHRDLLLVKNGSKTVEGRIARGAFSTIFPGQRLNFYNPLEDEPVLCVVARVTKYVSFQEMLEKEGPEKCLPGITSVEDGAKIYDAIPKFSKKAREHGVVGIQLQVVR